MTWMPDLLRQILEDFREAQRKRDGVVPSSEAPPVPTTLTHPCLPTGVSGELTRTRRIIRRAA